MTTTTDYPEIDLSPEEATGFILEYHGKVNKRLELWVREGSPTVKRPWHCRQIFYFLPNSRWGKRNSNGWLSYRLKYAKTIHYLIFKANECTLLHPKSTSFKWTTTREVDERYAEMLL